jgi:hypothetical protein
MTSLYFQKRTGTVGFLMKQLLVADYDRRGTPSSPPIEAGFSPDWHLAGLLTHASSNLNSLPEETSVAGAMLPVQFSAITVTG